MLQDRLAFVGLDAGVLGLSVVMRLSTESPSPRPLPQLSSVTETTWVMAERRRRVLGVGLASMTLAWKNAFYEYQVPP